MEILFPSRRQGKSAQRDRRDAARYRWLRDNCFINTHNDRAKPYAVIHVHLESKGGYDYWVHPGCSPGVGIPSLDTAVDAAIAKERGNG